MKKFLDCWAESFDSWNFYIAGYWIVMPIVAIIHSIFFSFIFNGWLVLLIDMIILIVFPIVSSFLDAVQTWENYK
jgi:hypothetical protein